MWHKSAGQDVFRNSKLWEVAKVLEAKGCRGVKRISRIKHLDGKSTATGVGGTTISASKYSREEDMVRRVLSVMAVVSTKSPFAILANQDFRNYVASLDPKHSIPHHFECNRIVEVMIDYVMMEIRMIVEERRKTLGKGFLSLSVDFWTDSVRKQAFGAIMMDIIAFKYRLNDGREMFMSSATAERVKNILVAVSSTAVIF